MMKLLLFALLFLAIYGCANHAAYPAQFVDETGVYKQVHDNVYHRKGDRITAQGYKEYKLKGGKSRKAVGAVDIYVNR